MRTTIRIHDDLYAQVRARAASTGRSIGEVVEDALRAAFAEPGGPTSEVEPLPTFGGSGVMPGVDLTSNAAVAEAMDEGVAVNALVDVNVLINAHRPEAPHHDAYREWLDAARTADEPLGLADLGNRVPDAYLAAMCIEQGATWYSADRDFARFPGLDWRLPVEPA